MSGCLRQAALSLLLLLLEVNDQRIKPGFTPKTQRETADGVTTCTIVLDEDQ